MRDGKQDGMQHFDGEIERQLRAGLITLETALSYATNPNNLRLEISDLVEEQRQAERLATV
jgi:twitching motility protein PilT